MGNPTSLCWSGLYDQHLATETPIAARLKLNKKYYLIYHGPVFESQDTNHVISKLNLNQLETRILDILHTVKSLKQK